MKQLTYTITSLKEMEQCLAEAEQLPEVKQAESVLLQIYTMALSAPDIQKMLSIAHECLPEAQMTGMTTGKVITCGEGRENETLLCISLFEQSHVKVITLDCEGYGQEDAAEHLIREMKKIPDVKGVQLLATTVFMSCDAVLSRIKTAFPSIALFGAGAGDAVESMDVICVFDQHVILKGISAVIYFGEELYIHTEYGLGWIPIGNEMTVTQVEEDSRIVTIDNLPAASIYEKYLKIKSDSHFYRNTGEFPLSLKRGGQLLERVPVAVDEMGKLYLTADIHVGEKVTLSYGNPDAILQETARVSHSMREFGAQSVFLWVGENRRMIFGTAADQELLLFANGTDKSKVHGCYAFSEIIQNEAGRGVLNGAIVAVGMREGTETQQWKPSGFSGEMDGDGVIPLQVRLFNFLNVMAAELQETYEELHITNQELNASNEKLKKMASTDVLTKIYNRRRIEQILRYELSKRRNANKLSLIMLDIDDFKSVNDTYGHDIGDNVLREFVKCMKPALREQDSIGRWGGEEFLVVLPDTTKEEVYLVAERIRRKISNHLFERANTVTVSIGVTTAAEGDTAESIYERVDSALYLAKEYGKNRVEIK